MRIVLLIEIRNIYFPLKWIEGLREEGHTVKILTLYENSNFTDESLIKVNSIVPGHRLKMIFNINDIKKKKLLILNLILFMQLK